MFAYDAMMAALAKDRRELTERQFLAKQRKNFKYGSKEYNKLTKQIKKLDDAEKASLKEGVKRFTRDQTKSELKEGAKRYTRKPPTVGMGPGQGTTGGGLGMMTQRDRSKPKKMNMGGVMKARGGTFKGIF